MVKTNAAVDPARLLTRADVAELLQVSQRTVMRWTDVGALPCTRLGPDGRTVRYRQRDVDELVERTASW